MANVPSTVPPVSVATWRKVSAAILDFFTVFFVAGYAISLATSSTTSGGFELQGGPALILAALIVAYYVIFTKYLGCTIWHRVLGVR
jgi:drug/metabolite transporter (DMT)-like permease